MPYDHKALETKWMNKWKELGLYKLDENSVKPKQYVLDMFPYPSGAGLHVGHVEGYSATDIYSRYLRMKGFNVLHPIGWDAFGLPAENYAVKSGIHPSITTDKAIETFKSQMDRVGLSYDWDRELGTHRPDYYKWTQWLFLLLYKKGLAYKKDALVNYCPSCQTVLANEQVVDGKCERCGTIVIQKMMNQWFFKITDYAERLIDGLTELDWPESTKLAQKNWIGKSDGAVLSFNIEGFDEDKIEVFTTRLDTIFGCTFIALAPEHPLVEKIVKEDKVDEVNKYIEEAKKKSELTRTSSKEKTGVFTGTYAYNPFNEELIPIYISDFVISTYAKGALMGVPAHDERDNEFAKKFNLPIKDVVNKELDAVVEGVKVQVPVKEDKKEIFTGMGVLVDSGEYSGLTSKEAYEKMITFAEGEGFGKRKIEYKLRDWLISRQRYWGPPIPMIYDKDENATPVNETDLPVVLPLDVDFKPTGESPLKYVEKFHEIDTSKYPTGVKREVDTLDTFVDSSWYFLRFCDPKNELEFANKEKINKLGPVDTYVGGAEHTVLHLLYARFFTKVLFDEGFLSFEEPFLKLRHPGMILGPDHAKMSKSKGNVINPTDTCEEYGADTLRMYEMFMGPLNISKAWSIDSIRGVRKFLQRVYDLSEHLTESVDKDIVVGVNKLIKKVESDTKDFKFNTAVSEFMIFVNLVEAKKGIDKESYTKFLLCLAPYAPFITDELYEKLGNTVSIHTMSFPTFDESLISTGTKTIVVQVNGKKRAMFEISEDIGEEEVYIKALELLKGKLEEKDIKKKIYIKGKIVSFVV